MMNQVMNKQIFKEVLFEYKNGSKTEQSVLDFLECEINILIENSKKRNHIKLKLEDVYNNNNG